MNEKVSILIPVYNREKLVCKAIESAINQTYNNIEIVVVDNCSTDNTFNVCKAYENKDNRIKVYRNNENVGPVKNWIIALAKATGYYTKILFSDDWIDENYIEECINNMEESVAFVFSYACIHNEELKSQKKIMYHLGNKNIKVDKIFFIENAVTEMIELPVSPGCAFFRTEDVRKNLIIDIPNNENLIFNDYGAGNDLLVFLLTLLESKYTSVKYICTVAAHFRAHCGSFTVINDLSKYYSYAKKFFIDKYEDNILKNKFKSNMYYKVLKGKDLTLLAEECSGKIDFDYIQRKMENEFVISDINYKKAEFLNNWISSLLSGEVISQKIISKYKKHKVSIYGSGSLGEQLYKQLKKENMINIQCFIDKISTRKEIECFNLDEYSKFYEKNELLVITPFYYFGEIKNAIMSKNIQVKIISIEELI